jgi:hypothetical protein
MKLRLLAPIGVVVEAEGHVSCTIFLFFLNQYFTLVGHIPLTVEYFYTSKLTASLVILGNVSRFTLQNHSSSSKNVRKYSHTRTAAHVKISIS